MSRLVSNSAFAVNSDYEQIVSINNASAIDQNIAEVGGTAVSLGQKVDASSIPVVIASDQSAIPITTSTTLNVDLDSVNGTSISLGQTTKSASIPVALASDTGTLAVSTTNANNSGSEGNLSNAQATISGDFSSEVDVRAARNITILGNTSDTSMNPINIHALVTSGGTKIKTNFSIYPDVDGNFVEKLENIAVNYIQLEYNATATVTASALFN